MIQQTISTVGFEGITIANNPHRRIGTGDFSQRVFVIGTTFSEPILLAERWPKGMGVAIVEIPDALDAPPSTDPASSGSAPAKPDVDATQR